MKEEESKKPEERKVEKLWKLGRRIKNGDENNWRAVRRWMETDWWQEKRDICSLRGKEKEERRNGD